MKSICIPKTFDYVGVYLTEKCHLNCAYCITRQHDALFGRTRINALNPEQWIKALNRLKLPKGVPITLQGGEPFFYKGIWEILDNVDHDMDILTALPGMVTKQDFLNLKTLKWNKRKAPYPTIRVSYHKGQHDYKELIDRIAELNDILSIGLFYIDQPILSRDEISLIREYAETKKIDVRPKEFLGKYKGQTFGTFIHPKAVAGKKQGIRVMCKNSVAPIAPDGTLFKCHSDLYFARKDLAVGNLLDDTMVFPENHLMCDHYGLCNPCDVKIKTNHLQIYGYTSVDIKFLNE